MQQHLEEAQALCQEFTVVDAHHDILMDVLSQHKRGNDGVLSSYWSPRLKQGGVDVQILPVFVEDRYLPEMGLREVFRMVEAGLNDIAHDNSQMELATQADDIPAILEQGKVAGILALEGCDGLGGDPALLRLLYRLGLRVVAFTWDRRNEFADGTGVPNPGGLSTAGKVALKEMMEHNILFDVSHLAEPGFWDAMDIVDRPIIASHSNAKAVCDHQRNLTNDQLKAIAETGGVIGLNFFGGFVDLEEPTLERMVDHLAHMVDLVGVEHVGIGADFLETPLRNLARIAFEESEHDPAMLDNWIPDCQNAEELPHFVATMLQRGFNRDEIRAILGENLMRVINQVLHA